MNTNFYNVFVPKTKILDALLPSVSKGDPFQSADSKVRKITVWKTVEKSQCVFGEIG